MTRDVNRPREDTPPVIETNVNLVVRHVEPVDALAWQQLYRQYGEFYQTPVDDDVLDRVWNWLLDLGHPLNAIVAIAPDSALIGLAHYRAFPETLLGWRGFWMTCLYRQHSAAKASEKA